MLCQTQTTLLKHNEGGRFLFLKNLQNLQDLRKNRNSGKIWRV